ncbi:helix-turn-helix domain-containing protein [Actinokineospora sp. PR83]|uniref:helix-turn-helix domain-containing protein n=1 Tax=Actinokineospora sp. PR83 TaxID=2884908 RepID=UPI001F35E9E8|nr:helix-turn-helix transcriptional regulator [Actinokineospora sp. PR83]MCG8917160.1 helix-turn-helix domain-containing protein [Actinokineospora sp. PR83]
MISPEHSELIRARLSSGLRRLRVDAGMTGIVLAKAVGISQPKLSKIETGMALPGSAEVRAIAEVTGAPEAVLDELLSLLRALHTDYESPRVMLHRGAHRRQQEINRMEEKATRTHCLQISMVPGQLQTERYMRTCFPSLSPDEVDAAVAARKQRQRLLARPDKQFTFLLTESAVRWCRGPAATMAEQVRTLIDFTSSPTVRLGVLPWHRPVLAQPRHSFYVYDERLVTISLQTAYTTIRDPEEVSDYLELFNAVQDKCAFGAEARVVLGRVLRDLRGTP